MKQVLTTEQVTENLQRLFPGKDIKCTEIVDRGSKWGQPIEPQFYIETNTTKLFIIGKMVWVKPSLYAWGNYCSYCNQFEKMYQKLRTKIGTCIPFTTFTRAKDKERHEQIDLLLIACGIKKEKQVSDIDRLRQLKANNYVQLYKLIESVQIIECSLENETIYGQYGRIKGTKPMLRVRHTTGSFSFPLESYSGILSELEEIQNIFLNLLGKPVTSKVKELIAA